MPHEFGVFVRSANQLSRAQAAAEKAGVAFKILDENVETASGYLSVGTMHLAKGLEFRAVAVMACDDEIVPLQERIETVGDDADLQEVYDTERHLLYVACTRARDHRIVPGGHVTRTPSSWVSKSSSRDRGCRRRGLYHVRGASARRAAPGAQCSQGPAPPLGRSPPRPTTSCRADPKNRFRAVMGITLLVNCN
jgi:ATP-dependent exoDNAse (exonuclease V) beta subunit